MKISFTSFDSTRGLGQPGDQSGSRRQKIILPFTLWGKLDICGRRRRKLRHVFRTQSALYFSSVIVNRNLANGSFKKRKWFPEDLTSKTLISSQLTLKNTVCLISSQSVQNNWFIECYLVPDHQEVFKYILEFAMLILTTTRHTRHCIEIITSRR